MNNDVANAILDAAPKMREEAVRLNATPGIDRPTGVSPLPAQMTARVGSPNRYAIELKRVLNAADEDTLTKILALILYGQEASRRKFSAALRTHADAGRGKEELVRAILDRAKSCDGYLRAGVAKLAKEGLSLDTI